MSNMSISDLSWYVSNCTVSSTLEHLQVSVCTKNILTNKPEWHIKRFFFYLI